MSRPETNVSNLEHLMQENQSLSSGFRSSGVFWTVQKPDEHFAAFVNYRPGEDIVLEVPAKLAKTKSLSTFPPDDDSSPSFLNGVLSNGRRCSALNATKIGGSTALGEFLVKTERYQVQLFVIGAHLPSESEEIFHGFEYQFDHLDQWVRQEHISPEYLIDPKEPFMIQFPFRYKVLAVYPLNKFGFELMLVSGLRTKNLQSHGFQAEYVTRVRINCSVSRSVEWSFQVLRRLTNLLTLLYGTGASLTDLMAEFTSQPKKPERCSLLFDAGSHETEKFRPEKAVRWKDISTDFDKLLDAWFGLSPNLQRFESLFLGTFYQSGVYVETHFLALAQAIESFHRVTQGGNLSFAQRVTQLLSTLSNSTKTALLPDPDVFVKTLRDTRNDLTHIGIKKQKHVLEGVLEFHKFNSRLSALLRLLFLRYLGVSETVCLAVAKHQVSE